MDDIELPAVAMTPEDADALIPKLAMELAAELSPPADVLLRYGLTTAEFAKIAKTPRFRQTLQECREVWNSDANAKERIQAKAAYIVEDSMLEMAAMVHNKALPATARIDSFKHLSKMARVDGAGDKEAADVGSKFSIIINLGDTPEEKIVVDTLATNPSDDGDSIEDVL